MIIYTGAFLYISRVKVRPDDNVESWISHSTNTPRHHNCGSREHDKVLLQTENKSWPATKSVTKVIFHSIWMRGQMSTLLIGTIYHYCNEVSILFVCSLSISLNSNSWVLTDVDLISGPWLGSRSANCSPNYLQSRPHRTGPILLCYGFMIVVEGSHYSHTDIINQNHTPNWNTSRNRIIEVCYEGVTCEWAFRPILIETK